MKKILSMVLGVFVVLIVLVFIMDTINSKTTSNGIDHMLDNYQNTYVGDNSSVSGILSDLPMAAYVSEIALQTATEPYGITIKYAGDFSGDRSMVEKSLAYNATALFALVSNVETIQFNVDFGSYEPVTFTREEMQSVYDRPLSFYALDEYHWANGIVRGPLDMSGILELSDTVIPDDETVTHTLKTDVGYSYDTELLETYSVTDQMYAFYVIKSRTSDERTYGYGIFDTSTGYYKFKETHEILTKGDGLLAAEIGGDYYFLIDNDACKSLVITQENGQEALVSVAYQPFIYRLENGSDQELDYQYLDENGQGLGQY